ncbi:hypothetical protein ACXYMO_02920 [Arenibacterium sp. CAU 1754]
MSNIEELQSRITAAMDKIGAGIELMGQRPAEAGDTTALSEALEAEKLANAQLEERLRALHTKHDDEMAALRAELDRSDELDRLRAEMQTQSEAMVRLDGDVQRLRQANEQLRNSNALLRDANEAGVGEPHLINKAMLSELEGLRAARATDSAEVAAVLAKLEPMLNSPHLTEGEEQ